MQRTLLTLVTSIAALGVFALGFVLPQPHLAALLPVEAGYSHAHLEYLKAPEAPELLRVTALSDKEVMVEWLDRSENENAFDVHIVGPGEIQDLKIIDANATSLKLTRLVPNTLYQIRVRARGPFGHSEFTEYGKVMTHPAAGNIAGRF